MVYGLEGVGFKRAVYSSFSPFSSFSLVHWLIINANCDVFLLFATELDRIHVKGKITAVLCQTNKNIVSQKQYIERFNNINCSRQDECQI